MIIRQISQNKNGDYYVIYELTANRSICPSANRKANEILIIGIPKDRFKDFCKQHNICVNMEANNEKDKM